MNNEQIRRRITEETEKLRKLGEPRHITKKFKDLSLSELRLKIAYLERDMAQATINQYEFTARTKGKLPALKKEFDIKIDRAHYYNRIDGVKINGKMVSAKEMEDTAITAILEEELLCPKD
jgi:hypothetical protein